MKSLKGIAEEFHISRKSLIVAYLLSLVGITVIFTGEKFSVAA
jgi:hypothetical protein